MKIAKDSTLLMIGDSITDCGRTYDAIPGGWGSFGEGYVSLVNACFTGLSPQKRIKVFNKGFSGDTILDLNKRWQQDVLDMNPDYVSIMIGINDVWRHFDALLQKCHLVTPKEFEETYDEIICKTKDKVKDIFILGPFMVESNRQDEMRKLVDEYAQIARNIANKHGLIYIDMQSRIDEFLTHLPSYAISSDRVHPNLQGHMILAKAFLDGVDFRFSEEESQNI
ncbi:MAG TPA: SGNH/GDSL hydrolase family protein [Candidatus Merdenecus merdavium]|nr:SGNH/GDSL hydrolase family protein [Candidatus Merdenecus merdavium]